MKKILALFLAVLFLSGCALSTIRPYKKALKKEPEPARKSIIESIESIIKPVIKPAPVVEEEAEEIK